MPHLSYLTQLYHALLLATVLLTAACVDKPASVITVKGKTYVADIDFRVLDGRISFDPFPTTNVVEIFWYGCIHCERFEPQLQTWLNSDAPASVRFERSPAIWNQAMVVHARAYYVARQLGLVDTMSERLFTRIIGLGRNPDIDQHVASIALLFEEFGVNKTDFMTAFQSAEVSAASEFSYELMALAGIESTPSFLVNGKYVLDPKAFGSTAELLDVVGYLAAYELDQQ